MDSAPRIRDLGWVRVGMGIATLAVVFWTYIWLWGGGINTNRVGVDFVLYRQSAVDWLSGHSVYLSRQLAGPYVIQGGDRLYPPTALLLFAPFVYLPAWLWWAVPFAGTLYGFWRQDLAAWTWPLVLLVAAIVMPGYLEGNPGIWMTAFLALGLSWSGPAALVLLKPTLAPFALPGIRHRSWWLVVAALAGASLLFGPLWVDWWRAAVVNPTNGGLLYNATSYPWAILMIVISLGRNGRPFRAAMSDLAGTVWALGRRGQTLAELARPTRQ